MRNPLTRLVLALLAASALLARQPVRARHAMVATVEPHATDVGVAVLRTGGNAVDAAVAVGFALAVTHPSAGNLGGGGFLLVRLANGETNFLDFRERAPGSATRNMYLDAAGKPTEESRKGYRASGVPGTVRGLEFAHRRYGRAKWADLVLPAEELARNGFTVSWGLARSLRGERGLMETFAESRRIFLKGGAFYEAGDQFVQPELARTLARIRETGSKDFYEGETARMLARDMEAHGGTIRFEDMRSYTVVERKPLTGAYHGYSLITAPPPSSGGVGILQMLGVLEGVPFTEQGAGSAASLHYMAEAMRRYFADRARYLGDPDFARIPVAGLLSRAHIERQRGTIDAAHATPSASIAAEVHESSETTHYTIVDAEGNVAAVTYTLNGSYGSGVTPAGLGFLLNNEMDDFAAKPGSPNLYGLVQGEANAIQPRKHPLSSMTPTIVLRDGRFYCAVGSPGGPTIINTVLQVIVNIIDFKMNMQEAIDQPRIHHQWMPDQIVMERSFSPDTVKLLESRGHRIRLTGAIGQAAGVMAEDGWLAGAADGRSEGTAKGY